MPKRKNPILDIEARKEILRLEIRHQEIEIREAAEEVVEYFTLPSITNNVLGLVMRNPEPALRLGVTIVEWITGSLRNRKTRKRRTSRKK
jgi:hypothetical protein